MKVGLDTMLKYGADKGWLTKCGWRTIVCWRDASVSLEWRCLVCRASVYVRLLDGLETLLLSAASWRSLESSVTKKLRCLLLDAARNRSHMWVRTQCKCYTLKSVARIRRLRLLRSVLSMSSDLTTADCALPSLLMGEGHAHGDFQVNLDGKLAHGSNHWLKELADEVM